MRKSYLLLLMTVLYVSVSLGQTKLKDPARVKKIRPVYSTENLRRIDTIQITVLGTLSDISNCSFVVDTVTLSNAPRILSVSAISSTTIAASAVVSTTIYSCTFTLELETRSLKDTLKSEETGQIFCNLPGQSLKAAILKLNNDGIIDPHKYDANKPFWIEIGSNFDLVDGLQANNFFSGVFFHKRDIRAFRFRKSPSTAENERNLSLFAGVYESKSISTNTLSDFTKGQFYYRTGFIPGRIDSVRLFRDTGVINSVQTIRNLGLFFSPQVRLTRGSANQNGFSVFASLWLELQWQRVSSTPDLSGIGKFDSSKIIGLDQINNYVSTIAKSEKDIRSHYFGLGLPIYYRENDVNVYFNPVIGISNQPSAQDLQPSKVPNLTYSQSCWRPFYVFQFRLNEEKYGFAFTGEVRGLIKKDSAPFVSLALTKKFDLNKFIEFGK